VIVRRTLLAHARRLVAALLATWFAVGATEFRALHRCPVHDGIAAMAGGATGHMHVAPGGGDQHDRDAHHSCNCPGPCCAAGPAMLGTSAELPAAHFVDAGESPAPAPIPFASGCSARTRPPATGPPRSAQA
jgi:hypothetical protein